MTQAKPGTKQRRVMKATVLDKRKLSLLDVPPFPAVIETQQMLQGSDHDRKKLKLGHIFTATISKAIGKRVLIVTFFSLETRAADFRVFFDGDDFITERLALERKWSASTLERMDNLSLSGHQTICANAKSARMIQRFFKSDTTETPLYTMHLFQQGLRYQALKQRHKREIDAIDMRMKAIRPLPKDFQQWANETMPHYFYYKRTGKRCITGYCTTCGNDATLHLTSETPWAQVRHNQEGHCPHCKKAVTFKAEGKTGRFVDKGYGSYVQKTNIGLVLRFFHFSKCYSNKPDNEHYYRRAAIRLHEDARHFFNRDSYGQWPLQGEHYDYGPFKQTGAMRWRKSNGNDYNYSAPLYTRNLQRALAHTPWQYSALYELAGHTDKVHLQRYMQSYRQTPTYEYLVKSRLYRLVTDRMSSNINYSAPLQLDGKDLPAILGVSKNGLRQMQRINGGIHDLSLIRMADEKDIVLTDAQLSALATLQVANDTLKELLTFTSPQRVINYISRCQKTWPISPGWYGHPCNTANNIAADWRDYLATARLMGYDMTNDFNLFPRELKTRHDEVIVTYKAEKDVLQEHAIAALSPTLQTVFGYTHKTLGLIAVAPATRGEIIAEGETLRHCVSTSHYLSRMAKGEGTANA